VSTQVPRFAHGSRVPGWDRAADLTKDPAAVPDPATTPVKKPAPFDKAQPFKNLGLRRINGNANGSDARIQSP